MRVATIALVVAGCGFSGQGAPTDAAMSGDGRRVDSRPGDPDGPPPIIDAAFDPALCPASYDRTVATSPGSRYRYIDVTETFATQHADCNDDHPGWTHLVVFDDLTEGAAIGDFDTSFYKYIGAVQQPSAGAMDQGWFKFTGGAVATGWSGAGGGQPDDADDGVEDGDENLAVGAYTGLMHDVSGNSEYRAVCECDGHAIDPTVAGFIP